MIERLVDLAADELGIDPAELRRRNYIPSDAMPYKTALTFTYDSGEFEKSMDMALKLADMRGLRAAPRARPRKRGKLRGIGLSNTIERAAASGFEGAEIRFDRSGTVTLFSGSVTQGQGHETIFKQIVCDRLGLDPGRRALRPGRHRSGVRGRRHRRLALGDDRRLGLSTPRPTRSSPRRSRSPPTCSRSTSPMSNFDEGIFSSPKTNRTLTIKEVAKDGARPGQAAEGHGGRPDRDRHLQPHRSQNFPNGCHVCEVEIDPDTGTSRSSRYSVVDDVGTVLNPLLLKGQIVGGVAQGIGQILMEDIRFDADGQLVTGSFMDYAMPRATDISAVEVKSNPVPTATNPLGVKGAGEAGCVGALPAVANAIVRRALASRRPHIEMPATPERVWRTIRNANGG